MVNNEFNKGDSVIVIAKCSDEHCNDVLELKGILLEYDMITSKNSNTDFLYSRIAMILNPNEYGITNKDLAGRKIASSCKILPCRIVLTEKFKDFSIKSTQSW